MLPLGERGGGSTVELLDFLHFTRGTFLWSLNTQCMGPHPMPKSARPRTLALGTDSNRRPFNNGLSISDVLYCGEVTLSLVRVLKMLSDCQRKNAPDVYVAYTVRRQDTGKLFITELGQFPTLGGFKNRAHFGLAPQYPSLSVL